MSVGAAPPRCVVVRPACSLRCARRGPQTPASPDAGAQPPRSARPNGTASTAHKTFAHRNSFVQLVRVSRRPAASRRKERVRTEATHRHAHRAKRSRIKYGEGSGRAPRPAQPASGGPPARAAKRSEHAGPCHDVSRRGIKSLMGTVGSVGPVGVILQFAIARRARGFQRYAAGAQPRPPPKAGPAAPRTRSERRTSSAVVRR